MTVSYTHLDVYKRQGVGCATATDIMGEWAKYDENPLLQNPGGLVGVGHRCV